MRFLSLALFGWLYTEGTIKIDTVLSTIPTDCENFLSYECMKLFLDLNAPHNVYDYDGFKTLSEECAASTNPECRITLKGSIVVSDTDLCVGTAGWTLHSGLTNWRVTSVKVNQDLTSCAGDKGYYFRDSMCLSPSQGTKIDIAVTEDSIKLGDGREDGYPAQSFMIPGCDPSGYAEFTLGIQWTTFSPSSAQAIITGGLFIAAAAFVL